MGLWVWGKEGGKQGKGEGKANENSKSRGMRNEVKNILTDHCTRLPGKRGAKNNLKRSFMVRKNGWEKRTRG